MAYAILQALQETLERQGEIMAYIEKKKKKKSKVTNSETLNTWKKQNIPGIFKLSSVLRLKIFFVVLTETKW
jgi:hypothetical protein